MAATQTVPQHFQHCNFIPITPQQGVVTLFGYGISARVVHGHLVLEDGVGTPAERPVSLALTMGSSVWLSSDQTEWFL